MRNPTPSLDVIMATSLDAVVATDEHGTVSQKCGVKSIETVWVSHEYAPQGYTLLIHDNADMSASTVYPTSRDTAHDWRIAVERS